MTTTTAIRLEPALASIAHLLVSQPDSPYVVHICNDPLQGIVSWMIVERDNCLAIVSYDPIKAYSVSFPIRPSHQWGSSLEVYKPNKKPVFTHGEFGPTEVSDVLELIDLATRPHYDSEFGTFPNHGWAHLSWAMDKISRWHDDLERATV